MVLCHQGGDETSLALEALHRPDGQVGATPVERPDQRGIGAVRDQVVTVGEGEVLAGGDPDPRVASRPETGVRLVHDPYPRVRGGDPVGDVTARVGRAVVDHHHVERSVRLAQDAVQRVLEVVGDVVRRHHHAQQRGRLARTSPRPARAGRHGVRSRAWAGRRRRRWRREPVACRARHQAAQRLGDLARGRQAESPGGRATTDLVRVSHRALRGGAASSDQGGVGDDLRLQVVGVVGLVDRVELGQDLGVRGVAVGQPVQALPRVTRELGQPLGELEVVPGERDPPQAGVDETLDRGQPRVVGRQVAQPQIAVDGADDGLPGVEEVVVAHEGARGAAGRALGVEHHVDPGGSALGVLQQVVVVGALAADDLRRRTQHRHECRCDAQVLGDSGPEWEEPGDPRVLDQHLRRPGELLAQPSAQLAAGAGELGEPAGARPGRRTGVADLDVGDLEQVVVVVDDPLGLREALGVGLVGQHLGLWHDHAEALQDPGDGAGPGPSRPGDQHQAARRVGGDVGRHGVTLSTWRSGRCVGPSRWTATLAAPRTARDILARHAVRRVP